MKVLGVIVAAILIGFAQALFSGWVLMLLSGAVGHAFSAPAFFISYGQSVLIAVVLGFIGSFFKGSKSDD